MTLLDEIRARVPAALRAGQDPKAIAESLSADRMVLVPGTLMGEGLVLAQLGFQEGSDVLDRFEAVAAQVPAMGRALRLLQGSRLDIGLQVTRDAIAALVPAKVMTAEQLGKLLTPGIQPAPVSEQDVIDACWSSTGEWLAGD